MQACETDWKEILDCWSPCLVEGSAGEIRFGRPRVDDYLELVLARAQRNTLLAAAYDLKVFFSVLGKDPLEVETANLYAFVKAQRQGPPLSKVVRLADGSAGLELSTIQGRLSTVSGFYAYLVATEWLDRSPIARGAATRTSRGRRRRPTAIVRPVRQLPRILEPGRSRGVVVGVTEVAGPGDVLIAARRRAHGRRSTATSGNSSKSP